jgi:hypothetical protein
MTTCLIPKNITVNKAIMDIKDIIIIENLLFTTVTTRPWFGHLLI